MLFALGITNFFMPLRFVMLSLRNVIRNALEGLHIRKACGERLTKSSCFYDQGSLVLKSFTLQIQEINETNLMNISTEFIGSHSRFKNKEVFHEMLNDLFEAVTTVISPITTNNSKLAIQFSEVRNENILITDNLTGFFETMSPDVSVW